MRKIFTAEKLLNTIFLFILFTPLFFSCENHRFDRDKRQIIAKDEIRSKLHRAPGFDITAFQEDTVEIQNDSNFKKQIRYSVDIEYLDSNKVLQKKKGIVMFAPDGQSVISSKITDR
ncbi:MAG: hypothetical protein ACTHK0_13340 [Ginsengibacter sp.]